MNKDTTFPAAFPAAMLAKAAPANKVHSILPEPFASRVRGRQKRKLGDLFGLTNFGVNLTCIAPGGISALQHCHQVQDEFIYVLEGNPTLKINERSVPLSPGMCAGFKAGTGEAHQLVNETTADIWYLEIGDRTAGDSALYPQDDLQGVFVDGAWIFTHKDGTGY